MLKRGTGVLTRTTHTLTSASGPSQNEALPVLAHIIDSADPADFAQRCVP